MGRIQKGSFDIEWGDNVLEDVTEIEIEYEPNSEDFETLGGQIREVDGAVKAAAVITLLRTDIPALAAVLPQHFVANGQVLSTGETVNHADGAIDVLKNCDDTEIYNDLKIISCGNPGQVFRMNRTRTRLEGIDNPTTARTVQVRFIGEAEADEANVQFYNEGTISHIS